MEVGELTASMVDDIHRIHLKNPDLIRDVDPRSRRAWIRLEREMHAQGGHST